VLSARLLGQAGVIEKKYAAQSSTYGPESRGTLCRAEVIISDEPIDYPYITEADFLIALAQEGYEKFSDNVKDTILFDPKVVSPHVQTTTRHIPIPTTEIVLKELGNKTVTNIIMLSALAGCTSLVSKESLAEAVRITVGKEFYELNLKALDLGWRLGLEVGIKCLKAIRS
ncbi:MAG TPA: 2-oxoacid:acceptor oxidoreductase family protein, partial [Candidatus Avalokitesvara rifleensis]|uniref:2-oxoacid:acceptor oxidoreductase family protein n=1 Tax=Candidatus Avalokitesvara rifleensis TaxID=3367620 RepID=UPI0040266B83